MRRNLLCKLILSVLLIFVTTSAVICFNPNYVQVVAAPDKNKNEDKTKKKEKKPTYTETLKENNELLKQLNKKQNKVLEKVKNEGKDWVKDAFAIIDMLQSDDPDELKICTELTKNILTSIAGIWGFDGIANELLNGIEDLTSDGKAPLSEVQVLTDTMLQQFNGMNDHLYDIENQLADLSNSVMESANLILSGTQDQINNLETKEVLRSFMSSGEGNFSYIEFSNYLYGTASNSTNSAEAYYILLLEAIQNKEADSVIKYYYDKLFEAIYCNLNVLNQYFYGDIAGFDKSIACYYYDYLYYNSHLVEEGSSPEFEAMMFALDLYSTYLYAYEVLEFCFAYQIPDIHLSETKDYKTANYRITEAIINSEMNKMEENIIKAEEQITKDLAYILNMSNSYITISENGDIFSFSNFDDSFGNLANGHKLYLNVFSDELCDLFKLDTHKLTYYIDNSVNKLSDKGIVDYSNIYGESFSASVKYGGLELYSMNFRINDTSTFNGGSGLANDPYLISNPFQLALIENDLNANYKLISNLEFITNDYVHYPIGTDKNQFTGTFDGNGYTISNLRVRSRVYDDENITMIPSTGIFGTTSETALIKDLTIETLSVESNYEQDFISPENPNSYYFIGGLVGDNRGTILNCTINNSSTITVSRNKTTQQSRNLLVYVGGIAGRNSGSITKCTVDGLCIDAKATMKYYNESISDNKLNLHIGGIVGFTTYKIEACRVSNKTVLKGYVKSTADSEDEEKPYVKLQIGGIIGNIDGIEYMKNVYSECVIEDSQLDIFNEGTYLMVNRYSYKNADFKIGDYMPATYPLISTTKFSEYDIEFYHDQYNKYLNKYMTDKLIQVRILYHRTTLLPHEIIEVSEKASADLREYINKDYEEEVKLANELIVGKTLDSYNNELFETVTSTMPDFNIVLDKNVVDMNESNLNVLLYEFDKEGNKILHHKFVDEFGNEYNGEIVSYYGFNTYHYQVTENIINVTVLFYLEYNGREYLMQDEVEIKVRPKELESIEISSLNQIEFSHNLSYEEFMKIILAGNGFELIYHYNNGDSTKWLYTNEHESFVISNYDSSTCGKVDLTLTHYDENNVEHSIVFTINIVCEHLNSDFVYSHTVDPTCESYGYDVYVCNKDNNGCGYTYEKNFTTGEHAYVVESGTNATCHEPGHTEKVYCSVCGEVFEDSQWIQALPHEYIQIDYAKDQVENFVTDSKYDNEEYHYCLTGNHYEAHQYDVTQKVNENGKLIYIFTCTECNYVSEEIDDNIITDEYNNLPQVFVTNGYVLNVGDEVIVYVQLLNNPGFSGANFGIRYTDGLELLSYEEGTIIPQMIKVDNEVYNGYNFLWADTGISEEDGYLLKLRFKYVSKSLDKQTVSIVYGMQNESDGGFTTLDNNFGIEKFMTHSGTISVVDYLPGDVDCNGVVDIMDATTIAWHLVGKTDNNNQKIIVEKQFADVNLDGLVDLVDIIAILQSITGLYGRNLLHSEYELLLDLNGYVNDQILSSIVVNYYNNKGERNIWNDNIPFEEYKALMNNMGYTFVGWYTQLIGGTQIDPQKNIEYFNNHGVQTLYAHWEKNKIIFNMNGATSNQLNEIVYDKNNYLVNLVQPSLSYDVDYNVSGFDGIYDTLPIYKTFIGWKYNGQEELLTSFDLSTPNLGNVELVAQWSDYNWILPIEDRPGYDNITSWYYRNQYTDSYLISNLDDEMMSNIIRNGFVLYGKENLIEYTISYVNTKGNVTIYDSYNIKSNYSLNNLDDVAGYTFEAFYDQNNNKITNTSGYLGDLVITAKWKPKTYVITINGVDVNNTTIATYPETYSVKNSIITVYYRYDDENTEKDDSGFYLSQNGDNKLTMKYLTSLIENSNFEINGCYSTSFIENNGHSAPVLSENSLVIDKDGNCVNAPIMDMTLTAWICPKLYTVTLDMNLDSKPALVLSSNGYKSFDVYYNECIDKNILLAMAKYYVAVGFTTDKDGGTKYIDDYGKQIKVYDIQGDSTMYCQWEQSRKDRIYIYDAETLKNIANNTAGYYVIICDIDLEDEIWSVISSFSGTLDGDGHTIYGLKIHFDNRSTGLNKDQASLENYGMFKKVTSTGTIKNIGFASPEMFVYTYKDGIENCYAGIICGTLDGGKISNIMIDFADINVTHYRDVDSPGNIVKAQVGAICGRVTGGTIERSAINYANITGYANMGEHDGDGHANVGGITGEFLSNGTISNCSIYNTKVTAKARGTASNNILWGDQALLISRAGGVAGYMDSGIISFTDYSGNTITATNIKAGSDGLRGGSDHVTGNICAKNNGGTIK